MGSLDCIFPVKSMFLMIILKFIYGLLCFLLFMIFCTCDVIAQKSKYSCNCTNIFKRNFDKEPNFYTVVFKDSSKLDYVFCLIRQVPNLSILEEQKVKVKYSVMNKTYDTLIEIKDIMYLIDYDIGGAGEPRVIRILPARECIYIPEPERHKSLGYLEIFTLSGYGGKDKSNRFVEGKKVGFNNFYFSTELSAFPFGGLLGDYLNLGIGTGLILENTRLRIPLKGEITYDFFSEKTRNTNTIFVEYYISDSCQFSTERNPSLDSPCGVRTKEITRYSEYDDSVLVFPKIQEKSKGILFPYVFAEGGWMLNMQFPGSDLNTDVLNKEDLAQYFVGGGLGLRIWDFLVLRLGYRFLRFNISSSCPGCQNSRVINTNMVNSITFSVGFKLNY